VPLANVLKSWTGNWHLVFAVTALTNVVVVAMSLFVLKPMRAKQATRAAPAPAV
jgi:MFS transporter, OFA family, oxalate/formate antiporter